MSADAFYLDADEIYEPDTDTTLAGAKLEYALAPGEFAGLVGGHVIESTASYAQANPGGGGSTLIANGRDGLNFLNAYIKMKPIREAIPDLTISGDVAYQWNDRIDLEAWGFRFGVSQTLADMPMRPTLSYNFHTMSGDKRQTSTLEAFDPLFNSGADWAAGANAALILSNSNISVHRIGVSANLSPRDIVGVKYFHISANELNSPLVFEPGSPTPPPVPVSGNKTISNEISVDYTRVLSEQAFFNVAVNYSRPGRLLEDYVGEALPEWWAATATLIIKF